MGVVIFTADDARYKTGDYMVMYGEMSSPPTAPDTTYILHDRRFSEKDALYWSPVIPYRMVVVVDKMPKLSKASEHCVVVDQTLKVKASPNYGRLMKGVMCWVDRDRANKALSQVPFALAHSFIRANNNDIELGRRIAQCQFMVSDDYLKASVAYGIEPSKSFDFPKRGDKNNLNILPLGVRSTDKHWDVIASSDVEVTNEIRTNYPESLPVGVNKTKESRNEWI
jgi:hypothetical protein